VYYLAERLLPLFIFMKNRPKIIGILRSADDAEKMSFLKIISSCVCVENTVYCIVFRELISHITRMSSKKKSSSGSKKPSSNTKTKEPKATKAKETPAPVPVSEASSDFEAGVLFNK
jgi:hypothetical protein